MQLGDVADGTVPMSGVRSRLEKYSLGIADGHSHVEAVSKVISNFVRESSDSIKETDALGHVDMANIFTEISRCMDKWLWFIEAHVQSKKQN